MTYGPIDFIALEFKGNQFTGEILPAVLELVNNGTIRVIDLVIVHKDPAGKVDFHEFQQAPQQVVKLFDPLKAEVSGIVQIDDLEMVGEQMEANCTAAVMLFENLWAIKFKEAVIKANGRLIMQERIPNEVVLDVLAAPLPPE